jgi:uncharacterized protein with ParB-like and HNH nuclease domain
MDVFSYTISNVFNEGGKIHYVLPHFQREYRWERKNWETLLEDAFQIYESFDEDTNQVPEHFLGALVVLPDGNIGLNVPVHKLVDGQQRLITVSLLLCAFASLIKSHHPEIDAEIHSYLFNLNQTKEGRYKLLPTLKNNDRAVYQAVLEGEPIPLNQSRIPAAFAHFQKTLQNRISRNELDAERFFKVLTQGMQVVCIRLNANENAYQIFESLNNKAEALKQSDLVRNYIAMRLSSSKQEDVYHQHWAPIEQLLDDNKLVGRIGELTAFLRHYDAMRTGALPSEKHVYARFRDEMKKVEDESALISELETLRRFAGYYDNLLRPDKSTPVALRDALRRLQILDVTTAFPLLLAIAEHFNNGAILFEEYLESCAIIENYLVRRFLIDAPTHGTNKMFAAAARALDWNHFLPSLRSYLANQKYPSDARVRQLFPSRSLYNKPNITARVAMLFETVNRHLYKGSDVVPHLENEPTIEHILPQTLSTWWQDHLGEDAEKIADEWKHTVGNLALVTQSYNSSLSNDSFPEKRDKLIKHGLKLNSAYFAAPLEEWNAEEIQKRAQWITDLILETWPTFAPRGEPAETATQGTPVALHLVDKIYPISSWRDALRQIAHFVMDQGADFPELEKRMPNMIRQTPFNHAQYDFRNGYFLNINLSGNDTIKTCVRLLQAANLGDVEWHIETHNSPRRVNSAL